MCCGRLSDWILFAGYMIREPSKKYTSRSDQIGRRRIKLQALKDKWAKENTIVDGWAKPLGMKTRYQGTWWRPRIPAIPSQSGSGIAHKSPLGWLWTKFIPKPDAYVVEKLYVLNGLTPLEVGHFIYSSAKNITTLS